ncbi:MAG: sulfite exporter TauE/SafE family protein [Bacteroidales bacterium]|nr:sulfite exporter TauE/SafE family protein [Bacteroidales bacterium]
MEWYIYILVILAGLIAGFINTLAGSGSLITLPMLMFLGLPPNVANGTNRISILLQSLVGSAGFIKYRQLEIKTGLWLAVPTIIGSVAGAMLALELNDQIMKRAIGILLVFMFFLVLVKPEIWLKGKQGGNAHKINILTVIVFFAIGLYGGFIQAGVGFFLLGGLVMNAGFDLIKANALKNLLVFLYTPFALGVFIVNQQVDYKAGFILAIGSMMGAWIATRVAIKRGTVFVRYILLAAILGSAVKLIFF